MPPTLPILHVTLRYTGPAAERAALALREIAASVAMIEGTVAVIETRAEKSNGPHHCEPPGCRCHEPS